MNDATVAAPTCPHCRGSQRDGRLTLAWLGHRFREDVAGLERGLLPTAAQLLIRPERVVDAYLQGAPPRYYGPFKYLLVATAISLLLMPDVPLFDRMLSSMLGKQVFDSQTEAAAWVRDWNGLVYAPMVLLLALAMRGFFRDRGRNYAEHLVIVLYAWAQMLIVATFALLLVAGLRAAELRGWWMAPLLLATPGYWLWFAARVLRFGSFWDWVRASAALPGAMALFLLVAFALAVAAASVQGWLQGGAG